jgi:hypothetical protein
MKLVSFNAKIAGSICVSYDEFMDKLNGMAKAIYKKVTDKNGQV